VLVKAGSPVIALFVFIAMIAAVATLDVARSLWDPR
jgi:hypothetical protein